MALIKCTECSKEVSDQATICPSCGAKKFKPKAAKKPTSITTWLIGAVVLAGVIFSAANQPSSVAQPAAETSGKSNQSKTIASCQTEWEMKFKTSMKDPDSLDWDHRNASTGLYKEKIPVVIVPYRAKNGFGALTLEKAICKIDVKTGDVLSVIQ